MTAYIGIDPGFKGAIAVITDNVVQVFDTPTVMITKTRRDYLIPKMTSIVSAFNKTGVVAIEKVHSMPRQGVASAFTFGKGYGIWLGVLSALVIPYEEVTPQRWQGAMLDGMQRGKDANRLRAMQLFPHMSESFERKKDDGRADALLIAEYRRRLG